MTHSEKLRLIDDELNSFYKYQVTFDMREIIREVVLHFCFILSTRSYHLKKKLKNLYQ